MGAAEARIHRWRKVNAGMGVSEILRVKHLEDNNSKLTHLVAERVLTPQHPENPSDASGPCRERAAFVFDILPVPPVRPRAGPFFPAVKCSGAGQIWAFGRAVSWLGRD